MSTRLKLHYFMTKTRLSLDLLDFAPSASQKAGVANAPVSSVKSSPGAQEPSPEQAAEPEVDPEAAAPGAGLPPPT